jgi:hypothetical protein
MLECSDVRLGWQETHKRVLELRRPVTVLREICSLGRMNDDRPDLEVFQQCRAFRPWSKREPIACYNLVLNSVRIIAREGSKRSATSNTANRFAL